MLSTAAHMRNVKTTLWHLNVSCDPVLVPLPWLIIKPDHPADMTEQALACLTL